MVSKKYHTLLGLSAAELTGFVGSFCSTFLEHALHVPCITFLSTDVSMSNDLAVHVDIDIDLSLLR